VALRSPEPTPSLSVLFRPLALDAQSTGALDIRAAGRRILSVPTQLGCRVGCTFCISSTTPVVRNLRAHEMLALVRLCLEAEAPDGCPLELSFTGEGEALLNHRETARVCEALPSLSADFSSVRYCFSGLGASRLLGSLIAAPFVPRIQFSLHAARQSVRERLVPRSDPLADILETLKHNESKFSAIELNVVLQDGVNDADEDLEALAGWGAPHWPILLNPLLQGQQEKVGARVGYFADALRARGRQVRIYQDVGAQISRKGLYRLLTLRSA
jgi:adenine C2-methylase RlmN of 23S rRNA A2503 and tRNA A37